MNFEHYIFSEQYQQYRLGEEVFKNTNWVDELLNKIDTKETEWLFWSLLSF